MASRFCFHKQGPRIALFLCLLTLNACATVNTFSDSSMIVGEAENVPGRFLVGSYDSGEIEEPSAGEGCRSPLVDPRDYTRIILVRSSNVRGDYEVPDGRYGVGQRQLLRVDCETGRALGIVRR